MRTATAGGAGAPYSDEAALKALKACYEIMQANNFTDQGPVSVTDPNMSFDAKLVQSMKFPRDVIRDRSGTCIELASLYCAMAHAVGLNPYMVLIPGHAFPAVELPSGGFVAVETTGVGGGKLHGSTPWKQAACRGEGPKFDARRQTRSSPRESRERISELPVRLEEHADVAETQNLARENPELVRRFVRRREQGGFSHLCRSGGATICSGRWIRLRVDQPLGRT